VIPENRRSRLSVYEPRTNDERAGIALTCAVNLELGMPMVVDRMDNQVASAYGGWPDRLYLLAADRTILYRGGEGPFGFKPEELEQAIERELETRGG
jgi:hypothetical protein